MFFILFWAWKGLVLLIILYQLRDKYMRHYYTTLPINNKYPTEVVEITRK